MQPGCSKTIFKDEIYCLSHHHQGDALQTAACSFLEHENLVQNLNFSGLVIKDFDFFGKVFVNCDFSQASFTNCTWKNCQFAFVFFDDAVFEKGHFDHCKIIESVFGCAHLVQFKIAESDVIQCNFNGATGNNIHFYSNDLMYNRFIATEFSETLFEDCNLKGVYFSKADALIYSFQYSNAEDAFFI